MTNDVNGPGAGTKRKPEWKKLKANHNGRDIPRVSRFNYSEANHQRLATINDHDDEEYFNHSVLDNTVVMDSMQYCVCPQLIDQESSSAQPYSK